MTVSVTVKTQRWPALVTLTEHSESDEGHESNVADTLIPADTMQTLHIGHLAQLTIREVDPGALGPTDDEGNDSDAEHVDGSVVKVETAGSADLTPGIDLGYGGGAKRAATTSTSTDTASPAASE